MRVIAVLDSAISGALFGEGYALKKSRKSGEYQPLKEGLSGEVRAVSLVGRLFFVYLPY